MELHPNPIPGHPLRPHSVSLSRAILSRAILSRAILRALLAAVALAAALAPATAQTTQTTQTVPSTITGLVLDSAGAPVPAADVTLTTGSLTQHAVTADDGAFRFTPATPGDFTLKVTETGLGEQLLHGTLRPSETLALAPIAMRLARVTSEVDVMPSDQVARLQLHAEEQQRLLGFIPNFYVSYDHNPAPLPARLKYQLAWRSFVDPVNLGLVAASAGIEQADGAFSGFGPGPSGYGKRLGAGLADYTIGSFLTGAILPQVFRQDPRYFYKGTGSVSSRSGYAVSMAVVCKGDNSRWQPCYSSIAGSFGAAAASNLYYPASNRHGAALTMENASLSLGYDAIGNLIQEFLLKRLTAKAHSQGANLP